MTVVRRGELTIALTPGPEHEIDDPDGTWHELLAACAEPRTAREAQAALGRDALAEADVEEGLRALVALGVVTSASPPVGSMHAYLETVSSPRLARSRAGRLPTARVAVIGLGGVGAWVALELAIAGVGALVLVDDDVVEAGNLGRQPYPARAVGERKIDALSALLHDLRPAIELRGVAGRIDHAADLAAIVADADVVVGCADRPTIFDFADVLARGCRDAGVPYVVAAYAGRQVRVGPAWSPARRGACASCAQADPDGSEPDRGPTRAELRDAVQWPTNGVSIAQAATAASLAVADVLALVTGRAPALLGRTIALDLERARLHRRRVPPRAGCPTCSPGLPRDGGVRTAREREEVIP